MRHLTDLLQGISEVILQGAAPEHALNRLNTSKIPFWELQWAEDRLSVRLKCYTRDITRLFAQAKGAQCEAQLLRQMGLPALLRPLAKRWLLLLLLTASASAVLILPHYVWFYQVEGNQKLPKDMIIRAVQEAGVPYGCNAAHIRPKLIKEAVTRRIPEIRWLTVRQAGGVAYIDVREREQLPRVEEARIPRNVVASRDGVVTSVSVLDGAAAVQQGQAVKKGQLLIGGYVDLEYKVRACGAKGEVYAYTNRSDTVVMPKFAAKKDALGKEKCIWYLCIGRKRIKLSFRSGISAAGCVKMSREAFLTLPGGRQLPVCLICETYKEYIPQRQQVPEDAAKDTLSQWALERARRDMIAGVVLRQEQMIRQEPDRYVLKSSLECEEMIGRIVDAEIFKGEEIWNES